MQSVTNRHRMRLNVILCERVFICFLHWTPENKIKIKYTVPGLEEAIVCVSLVLRDVLK
jgi:hypothetical protein